MYVFFRHFYENVEQNFSQRHVRSCTLSLPTHHSFALHSFHGNEGQKVDGINNEKKQESLQSMF